MSIERTLVTLGVALVLATPGARAVDPAFSDQTAAAGINVLYDASGYTHWYYTGGGAAADFDRDGFQDLFILDGNGRDHLYINNGDGTFTDQAIPWGLTVVHKGKGAAVGDYDRNGWPDIYVTSAGVTGNQGPCKHKLYRNNGNSTFTEVAAAAGVQCTTPTVEDGFGSTFGDYDLDGDLDLFVGGFGTNNSGNKLFRNNGDGTFTNVTATINLFAGVPGMFTFAPRLIDLNEDDYPELLMVSDFGTSHYFRNNTNGTFSEITAASGLGQEENGMGQTFGDFNRDGLIDLYVTSIYLPSNGWTGNKLYLNGGGHHYTEVSGGAGVFDGGYGWGAVGVDFDHNGWEDILETNGDNSGGGTFFNEPSYLWMNGGTGTFVERALASGLVHLGKGRGLSRLDYDNDGDQDVVIFANNETVMLYRNDLAAGSDTHWLRVFLDTVSTPGIAPDGYGSRVRIAHDGIDQVRYLSTGDTFLSHSEPSAHFGLGTSTLVDQIKVHWPDGVETTIDGVEADRTITLLAHHGACSPAPPAVPGLLLGKSAGELTFQWTPAGLGSYVVLADSAPEGRFGLLVGSAGSGASSLQTPMPVADRYFLVSGRQNGCVGP